MHHQENISEIEISKITGFIYGSFSTRFWMMRIGLNDTISDSIERGSTKGVVLPFYAWQCISLQTESRDVDLVIPDDQQLKMFIQFLMIKLNTKNGLKHSLGNQEIKHKIFL